MSCCAKKKVAPVDTSQGTLPALNKSYQDKVKPAEKRFLYDQFATPSLAEGEILAKPIVLLLGQYSVGKTSMIKYLLNGEYPGAEIGPEPTTDIFAHIQYSENTVSVEGPTLIADKDYSLKSLEMFGETFLNKLRSTNFKADLLQHMSIIDTPGILSGEKQIESRGYDFASIIRFLADRVDRILLMFDANKLDISDEYKQVILCLAGHDEKIKIVLNKADSVKPRELIMVRGALMWSLGKILTCPEVPKVFTTSMWQYEGKEETPLTATMREDTEALLADIMDLPNTYKTRRINDLVRRTRMVRIHSYVMHEVLCTGTFGIKVEVATNPRKLIPIYRKIERNRRIVRGDLPSPEVFHKQALKTNVKDWKKLNKLTTSLLDTFLNEDITVIVEFANKEEKVSIDCKPMDKIARAETPKSTKQALAQKEGQARDKVKANDKKEDKEGNKEDEKEKKKSEKEVKDGKKQAASKKKRRRNRRSLLTNPRKNPRAQKTSPRKKIRKKRRAILRTRKNPNQRRKNRVTKKPRFPEWSKNKYYLSGIMK